MVNFCADDRVVSCADDGKVIIWEQAGNAVYTIELKHSSPIRSFAFNDQHETRLLAGRTDGTLDAWDVSKPCVIDSIYPESNWYFVH
jgi:WD40 repeat protein